MDKNVTLESLLDAPVPSPLSLCKNNALKDLYEHPKNNEPSTKNDSVLVEASLELVRLLIQQDSFNFFIYPFNPTNLPPGFQIQSNPKAEKSFTEIEKKIIGGKFCNIHNVLKSLKVFFNVYLNSMPTTSLIHKEACRLITLAESWYENLPDHIKSLERNSSNNEEPNFDKFQCLQILNPYNSGILTDKERIQTIGEQVGHLKAGTSLAPFGGYREDHRNKVTPYIYLDYGPFASFGPCYDSGASHCTRETNDLVLGTCWLPARIMHIYQPELESSSPQHDLWDDKIDWDNIPNPIEPLIQQTSNGQDPQLNSFLQSLNEERRIALELTREHDEIIHFQPVSEDGDDFHLFLANAFTRDLIRSQRLAEEISNNSTPIPKIALDDESNEAAKALESSAEALRQLYNSQYRRLGDILTNAHPICLQTTQEEYQDATRLSNQLVEMCSKVKPRDIIPVTSVRKALGLAENLPLDDILEDSSSFVTDAKCAF